eukprot:g10435.t1
MAFAEIVGSLLVLWRWRKGVTQERGMARKSEQLQEVYFAGAIATMTTLLGLMLLHTSVEELLHPVPKASVAAGIFVSAFGASCSFLLWAYKAHYGRVLRSMVLLADAKCSLCVGLISLAVVAALVLEKLVPLMHERLLVDKGEDTALLEETISSPFKRVSTAWQHPRAAELLGLAKVDEEELRPVTGKMLVELVGGLRFNTSSK